MLIILFAQFSQGGMIQHNGKFIANLFSDVQCLRKVVFRLFIVFHLQLVITQKLQCITNSY